jgi:3-oxoacyl-[acyl-carrier protein] reductase
MENRNNKNSIYLEGKSAVVTGGSLGIGTAIALKLADFGANVAIKF